MLVNPECPVCDGVRWETVGERTFRREPRESDAYLRLRQRVLFELWSPQASVFVARFQVCSSCGFVCYAPRATVAEIDAKYRLIAAEEQPAPARLVASALDRERARDLFRAVEPYLNGTGRDLLDFGGGNGALLTGFAQAGFRCGVVDYTPRMVPGVTRLGATLDELEPSAKFDVTICSHVFEHLADPLAVARRLRDGLRSDGVLLIEVPLEIVGGSPRMREPVTHVNFFCESSLSALLQRAGFEVLSCRTEAALFASGLYGYAVRAVARPTSRPTVSLPGVGHARSLLRKRRGGKLALALSHPKMLLNPVRAVKRRLTASLA